MGLERVVAMQEIKKFAYNFMKAKKLIEMEEKDIPRQTYWSTKLNDELYALYSQSIQMDKLRSEKLDNNQNYGCGLLNFDDTERNINKLTHYFSWLHCIKSKSYIKSKDYDTLIELIQEYEQKYHERVPKPSFNIFADNNDDIMNHFMQDNESFNDAERDDDNYDNEQFEQMIDFKQIAKELLDDLQNNDSTYNYWMTKLKNRVSIKQIQEYIMDYFIGNDGNNESDSDASSSDEDEICLNGNDIELKIDIENENENENEVEMKTHINNNENDSVNDDERNFLHHKRHLDNSTEFSIYFFSFEFCIFLMIVDHI